MSAQIQLIPDRRAQPSLEFVSLSCLPPDTELIGPAPSASFIASVRRFGVLQPVPIIRGQGDAVPGGRRRVKAARAVGLEVIPAAVFPEGWTPSEVIALIENEQRGANPASDVRAIRELMEIGAGRDGICAAAGLPKATFEKRLKLCHLHETLLDAYESGDIKTTTAEAAARLAPEKQAILAGIYLGKGKLTQNDVAGMLRSQSAEVVAALPEALFENTPIVQPVASSSEVAQANGLFSEAWKLFERGLEMMPDDAPELDKYRDWPGMLMGCLNLARAVVPPTETDVHRALDAVAAAAGLAQNENAVEARHD